MLRNKKAQSTLEYVVILTVIASALIVGLGTVLSQKDKTKGIGLLMDKAATKITTESAKISTGIDP